MLLSASFDTLCTNAHAVPHQAQHYSIGKAFHPPRSASPSVKEEIVTGSSSADTGPPPFTKRMDLENNNDDDGGDRTTSKASIEELRKEQNLPASKLPFLWKLHILLDDVETCSMDHIIGWLEHGRSFKVYRPKSFMAMIAPLYFKQTKFKSFQRQLHLYEFVRVSFTSLQ
jgi:hypothetical protein